YDLTSKWKARPDPIYGRVEFTPEETKQLANFLSWAGSLDTQDGGERIAVIARAGATVDESGRTVFAHFGGFVDGDDIGSLTQPLSLDRAGNVLRSDVLNLAPLRSDVFRRINEDIYSRPGVQRAYSELLKTKQKYAYEMQSPLPDGPSNVISAANYLRSEIGRAYGDLEDRGYMPAKGVWDARGKLGV